MISKYNENTIQIPHGTKPDTQDCGHAKKEEVRTMSYFIFVTFFTQPQFEA